VHVQRARLDLHQRSRHHQEFTGHIDVDVRQLPQKRQVLIRDLRDRNVMHVHFRPADQIQQQIHRAVERIKRNLVFLL
jgi:hypothetical protein